MFSLIRSEQPLQIVQANWRVSISNNNLQRKSLFLTISFDLAGACRWSQNSNGLGFPASVIPVMLQLRRLGRADFGL